jgi:hypothetical protein
MQLKRRPALNGKSATGMTNIFRKYADFLQ